MNQFYKIYLQKEAEDAPLKETIFEWGIYCKDIPFKMVAEAKSLTERDWADEQGKDVYVPEKLMMKGYEMTITLCCKGDKFSANTALNALIEYMTGADGNGVYMKMYCDYTKIGRRHIRFLSLEDNAELVRNDEDGDILVFSIKVSVDDPVTVVTPQYTNNEITGLA